MREEYKFLMPSLILCAAIVAFPTVFLLYVSFQRWVLFEPGRAFTGFGNFWSMISSSEFLESVRVTAIFVVSSTLVTLILGLALALILSERLKGRGLFRVAFTLPAIIIAQLYKARWRVELFFKWIKQHLRIKKFYGTSANAVKTQIWTAVCAYVLVAIVKKELGLDQSLYTILQFASVSIFEKTPIWQALTTFDSQFKKDDSHIQLPLFDL